MFSAKHLLITVLCLAGVTSALTTRNFTAQDRHDVDGELLPPRVDQGEECTLAETPLANYARVATEPCCSPDQATSKSGPEPLSHSLQHPCQSGCGPLWGAFSRERPACQQSCCDESQDCGPQCRDGRLWRMSQDTKTGAITFTPVYQPVSGN